MTDSRAPGRPTDSATRTALLDAAMQLMLDDGYAAITTRKVAARAGVNPALVHYHFRNIDGLLLAVFRRGAEAHLTRLQRAVDGPRPLRGVWDVISEPRDTALTVEFLALAHHRKAIQDELADYSTRFRRLQEQALARVLDAHGITPDKPSLPALTLLLSGLPRILAMDATVGLRDGHDEVLALVEEQLRRFEVPSPEDDTESP